MIPVVWLQYETDVPARGYWDQGLLEDLLTNQLADTGYSFDHRESLDGLDGAIVVFPTKAQTGRVEQLNADLSRLRWVILILTSDEEAAFDVERVTHPNMRVWVQFPRPTRHALYDVLGCGYPPQMRALMPSEAPDKDLDWFFAGQITHVRRQLCAEQLQRMGGGEYLATPGFTQGLPPADYYSKLARTKVVPCPSGPEIPDTFRLFEALEAACVPIADAVTPKNNFPPDYWTFFFGEEPPYPVLTNYESLPGYTDDMTRQYPAINNRVFAWWLAQKRKIAHRLRDQIHDLSSIPYSAQTITVLVPSSPTERHPSTDHIEETIERARLQLPDAEIIVMLDGVRPEQEHHRAAYEEYQRRLLWLCNYRWRNVLPMRFEHFGHQSGMTRRALELVQTPLIVFCEHDTPLVPDRLIEWDRLSEAIITGQANVIRFHYEAHVLEAHEPLMIGEVEEVCGAKMRRTFQWSQRPHLASTAFYREMLRCNFREESTAFIEDHLYGVILDAVNREGILGWNLFKLWMYHPDGGIQRSYNLDSRGAEQKYECAL